MYPPEGSPYAFRRVLIASTQAVRQEIDVTLPRGVLIKGKVVESPSGRAVAGAIVEYRPRQAGNRQLPEGSGRRPRRLRADGRERAGWIVPARRPPRPGPPADRGPHAPLHRRGDKPGQIEDGMPGGPRMFPDGLLVVDAPAGAEVEATVTLRRGRSLCGASSTRTDGPRSTRRSSSGPT